MKQFFKAFGFAANGVRQAIVTQRNMKVHFVVTLLVVFAGIHYNISATEWSLILLAVGLVVTAEMMNSSIEGLVDLLEPNKHPLAGRIKDIAAGGVLIAASCAAGVGLLVFIKYVFA